MTAVQFTYMMGVLWLIFAGVVRSGDRSDEDWQLITWAVGIGVVHLVVALGLLLRSLFLGG